MRRSDDKPVRPHFEERWRKRFIEFAGNDDDAGIAGWSESGLRARFHNFQSVWPGDRDDALWLDVGCGAGTYSRWLADRHIRVIGMDYSYPTVNKAKVRGRPGSLWAVADVNRLPVSDGSFDGVLCFGVVQALAGSTQAARELTRVVKTGGQVWVDALNGWCLPTVWNRIARRVKGKPAHLRYESPKRLRRLLRDVGCESVRIHWVPILPQRLQRYQWLVETASVRRFMRLVPLAGALFSHAFVLEGRRLR